MAQIQSSLDYEIILLLTGGERHVRGISKTLNASHSSVLRRLNALSKDNVLDSKTLGRNRVFFIRRNLEGRNYVYCAERYKLNQIIKKYPALAVTLEDVLKKTDERLIVLFGSYAKESAKEDSDVDIYVETTSRKVKEALESVNNKMSVKTGVFNPESLLIKEIIKNHVIIRGVEDYYEKTKFFS